MKCDYEYDYNCLGKAKFIVKYKEPLQHDKEMVWRVCEHCKNVIINTLQEHEITYTVENYIYGIEKVIFT